MPSIFYLIFFCLIPLVFLYTWYIFLQSKGIGISQNKIKIKNPSEEKIPKIKIAGILKVLFWGIILFLLLIVVYTAVTKEETAVMNFAGSNGSSKNQILLDSVIISEVESNSSIILRRVIKSGETNLSFNYQGEGEIEIIVYPIINTKDTIWPVRPAQFRSVELEETINFYQVDFICERTCEINLIIKIPKGGSIKLNNINVDTKRRWY